MNHVSLIGIVYPNIMICEVITQSCLLLIVAAITWYLFSRLREAKRVNPNGKYILITGCDTGFGKAFAKYFDEKGFHVFATCLSSTSPGSRELMETGSKRMRVLQLDVTSDDSVEACLKIVKEECQSEGLWGLVNNAGIMINLDVELQSMENYKRVCDVNLFGMVRTCKAFLPLIRKQKGRVVNITSVRGILPFPTGSAYCMSKFGAEGFTHCLRLEMERFGVKVSLIEPGMYGIHTGMFNEENANRLRKCFRETIDKAPDAVKEGYGESYLDRLVANIKTVAPSSDDKLRGVLDAAESALMSVHPRASYLVDSSNSFLDDTCILARLSYFLPMSVMDRLYMWQRPLVPEAFDVLKT